MTYLYSELKKKDGQNCYTLTKNIPARMSVDDQGVTIHYQSGNDLFIPKQMVLDALQVLKMKGELTLDDVFEKITEHDRARTDRLLAIVREVPGVKFSGKPRRLWLEPKNE